MNRPVTRNQVLIGDARERLARLPDSSVDMVLTSPPYFQLRDYAMPDQLGFEASVDDWVHHLQQVTQEVKRVLVPTGTLWLNLGDSYAIHPAQGAGRKSLLLGPERLALALLAEGWLLRNKIVWRKSNPMPTSVRDRLACTWEALYVFAKQPSYFFDLDVVRAPHRTKPMLARTRHFTPGAATATSETWRGANAGSRSGLQAIKAAGRVGHPLGKNPGDVWTIASSSYRGTHHATFPITLATRAIAAGCPETRCQHCRKPWRRNLIRDLGRTATRGALGASCSCRAASEPGLLLDPFIGAGTTAVAAEALDRDWLGIELNASFAHEATNRVYRARAGPSAVAA